MSSVGAKHASSDVEEAVKAHIAILGMAGSLEKKLQVVFGALQLESALLPLPVLDVVVIDEFVIPASISELRLVLDIAAIIHNS